eukprot:TRINITY_DN39679_c0_g1_i1.p1 TRINITY_DN39679_c0_g1~~TRINITY_DN39679_c0_g1_i1.p1  ORF type:complete len:223 (-),score=13.68 TRINITY_DN39679_c0_g1_i1:113-781(-)
MPLDSSRSLTLASSRSSEAKQETVKSQRGALFASKDAISSAVAGGVVLLLGVVGAVGSVLLAMSLLPPEDYKDGSCQVTGQDNVTWECVGGGQTGSKFKLDSANVTFEDGSVTHCSSFQLSDGCSGGMTPDAVLSGEARPCKWFEHEFPLKKPLEGLGPGSCMEPGVVRWQLWRAISVFMLAPLVCCCGLILCLSTRMQTSRQAGKGDGDADSDELESLTSR